MLYQRTDLKSLIAIYEKVIIDLIQEIKSIKDANLDIPIKAYSSNEHYKTLQHLLTTLLAKCYYSAATIYTIKGNRNNHPEVKHYHSVSDYIREFRKAFVFTKKLFVESLEEGVELYTENTDLNSSWISLYQQALEQAIVQVLRHKMLIENARKHSLSNDHFEAAIAVHGA